MKRIFISAESGQHSGKLWQDGVCCGFVRILVSAYKLLCKRHKKNTYCIPFVTETAVRTSTSAPVGIPMPSESDDLIRFELLRKCLRYCDMNHDCNKHQDASKLVFPTRVLFVGDQKDSSYAPDVVRLVYASECNRQEYVTLSHCWGNLTVEEKKKYCTTKENLLQRRILFSVSDLLRTFQDAIKVTRELGVLYLWIDSLCIIQYGDNGEDWNREAGKMETIFQQSYCTIAATSAIDSHAGFLEHTLSSEHVHVQDASGNEFYMSTDLDDYDNDVGKAQLYTRAWVMQEEVLARRTIHFTANQTYFEYGEGIQCENLTVLER